MDPRRHHSMSVEKERKKDDDDDGDDEDAAGDDDDDDDDHASEMRGLWHQLGHSGHWQLVLGRMRPATAQRAPLAQHLGKMLETL